MSNDLILVLAVVVLLVLLLWLEWENRPPTDEEERRFEWADPEGYAEYRRLLNAVREK